MPGLLNSGWDLVGFGSQAATVDVGFAVGGGRFELDIKDPRGSQRKLAYGGISVGGGLGVHSEGAGRFALNIILPMLRVAVNSLDLPSRQSRLFLLESFTTPPPLTWDGDFMHKSILIYSIGGGMGFGLSGSLILFFPNRGAAVAGTPLAGMTALSSVRAVAFSGGMQMGQLGADVIASPCLQL